MLAVSRVAPPIRCIPTLRAARPEISPYRYLPFNPFILSELSIFRSSCILTRPFSDEVQACGVLSTDAALQNPLDERALFRGQESQGWNKGNY
jgi:hypothetical protein